MTPRFLQHFFGALLAVGAALRAAEPTAPNPRLTGTPFLRVWQAEDYGAAPGNHGVLQHPGNGFMYAANGAGVLEFDGVRWRLIPVPKGDAAQGLVSDARGRIWYTNDVDVGFLSADAQGELRATSALGRIPAGEPPVFPLGTMTAGPDGVYVVNRDRVFLFPDADGPARVWRPVQQGAVTQLWTMDGRIHIRGGPGVFALADGKFQVVPGLRTFAFVTRPDPAGGWLLASRDGLRHWDGGYRPVAPGLGVTVSPLENDVALCAIFLADGRIAFGTSRSGVIVSDLQGQRQQVIDRTRGLPSNRVEALCADRDGGLWISLRNGLARAQLDSPYARHGTTQRRVDSAPQALALHRGHLYVGGGESLTRRDASGIFQPIADVPVLVRSLVEHGEHLFATGLELRKVGPDDQARRLDATYYGLVPLGTAPGYFAHGNGDGVALDRFDGEKWHTLARCDGISGATSVLGEWPAGVVWAANHTTGLWRIDFRGGVPERPVGNLGVPLKNYGRDHGLPGGLNQYNIELLPLGGGLDAIAVTQLLRFDEAADRFVPETRIHDLPTASRAAPAVRVGHAAADGSVWLQLAEPSLALRQLVPAGADRWRATPPPGPLPRMRLNRMLFDAAARTLWLAGPEGLVSCDLDWQRHRDAAPLDARIRRVESAGGVLLWTEATAPGPLALPPARNALRFVLAAPSFGANPVGRAPTRFRTRLEGLDREWTPWTTEAQRDFTNLPYRDFVFHVQAADDEQRMSDVAMFRFAIAAPWWLTRWAFASYGLAGLGLLAGLVRLRLAALRRRNEILEATVTERTREIARLRQLDIDEKLAARLGEEKARLEMLRYQLNPHFLYNALNSIRALVSSSPKSAGNMVTQLSDFCRVTLTRPDEPGPVAEEFDMLRLYLEMEQTRWRDGLVVEIDLAPAAAGWRIPPFLLLSLVENALKHGRQSTAGVLTLRLSARVDAEPGGTDVLVLEVANSGTWLEAGQSFAPSTGVGLDNLRQRLRRYYRDRHTFRFNNTTNWVRAEIRLAGTPSALAPSTPDLAVT
ncbi:MAG TPA: histidine kinase [Opitutaceae bacterium]|nr:histidine kinase [Opitutaceae bacterium]